MKTSEEGLALIKAHEGLRLKAYPDPGTGGEPFTVGYGTTSAAGVGKITRGMTITKVQAESMLVRSLEAYEKGVLAALTRTPTQNQFDAMVSLAYNIGVPRFQKSSVVRFHNAGFHDKAAAAFLMWTKSGKGAKRRVLPGLVKRRNAEHDLYLKPDKAASATPAGTPKAP